jgi:hypothetical protein
MSSTSESKVSESAPGESGAPKIGEAVVPHADETGDDLRIVLKTVAFVGLLEALLAAYISGRTAAISVGYGALLGFGNLLLLGRMVRSFLSHEGVSMPWVVAALLKLAVLCLAMYLPVRAGVLALLPFVFGFGALPVGIVASQFLRVPSRNKAN